MSRRFGGEGLRAVRHVLRAYPALLRVGLADMFAYRAELVALDLTDDANRLATFNFYGGTI